LLPADGQQELLGQLTAFRFNGRASVRGGSADFVAPSLSWRQRDAASEIQLAGQAGFGRLELRYSPTHLQVSTSRGDSASGEEAERFIVSQLGFLPPFAALRYWVLGLADPEAPIEEMAADANGRLARLAQRGWQIEFTRWKPAVLRAGGVLVPQRLVATNGQLRLTVIIDGWQLGSGR
jgi:outer membrane lipoprotein LolB